MFKNIFLQKNENAPPYLTEHFQGEGDPKMASDGYRKSEKGSQMPKHVWKGHSGCLSVLLVLYNKSNIFETTYDEHTKTPLSL